MSVGCSEVESAQAKTSIHPLAWIRSAIYILIFFPLVTAVLGIIGMSLTRITGRREIMDRFSRTWSRTTLFCLNIEVIEIGREHLKKDDCLYLFNHTSFFDIMVMQARLAAVHFGAKIELFKIPIFGRSMRVAGMLPIARERREEVMRVYKEAEERARNGEQFALSPEGGRNNEEYLLPFKSGPFIFAINAGLPLTPVVIKGAREAWPKGHLVPASRQWKHIITVQYLPRVSVSGLTVTDRAELAKKVRGMMLPFFPGSPP